MPIDKAFNDAAWRAISPWVCAAGKGEIEILEKALADGMKVDGQDINGTTALMAAVRENKEEAVHFLLGHGADVHIRDRAGWSALDYAAGGGHLVRVRELLLAGADPKGKNDCDAAFLREVGGKTRRGINLGATALMLAAREGHTEVVRVLIEAGADVNAKNKWNDTALGKAAEGAWTATAGNAGTVKLLLEKGADANTEDANGWTPLMRAAWHGHADVMGLLLAKADPAKVPVAKDGWQGFIDPPSKTPALDNALLLAAAQGNTEGVKLLADKGANVNVRQSLYGSSALYWAALSGHAATVRLLLDRGADPKIENFNGIGPADAAKTREIGDMIRDPNASKPPVPPAAPQTHPAPPPPG